VDLKQVWFAGVHADVGGSYPPDKDSGLIAADAPLAWMVSEAKKEGLKIEPQLTAGLTEGAKGQTHKSRNHVYRFKTPLHRPLIVDDKPTKIHPSVK